MINSDKEKFVEVLNATSEMYQQKKAPTPMMVMMYFGALEKWSLADVMSGINKHSQNTDGGEFFPKPADIIRSIEGNSSTRAEQAWTKVDTAIKSIGPHQSVVFDDGFIHAVIDDMGGWVNLCEADDDSYPFKHNEFIKRYQGFIVNPPDSVPKKLIGISEGYNSGKGYKTQEPLLIGNADKAALVYQQGSEKRRVGLTVMSDEMKNIGKLLGN